MKVRYTVALPLAFALGALWLPYLRGNPKSFTYDLMCAASGSDTGFCDEARPGMAAGIVGSAVLAGLAMGVMLDRAR
ncbi:MAG: hypothetical protein M0D55_14780 [Elusimicrobiota bacterium]|nr:MAG: hypothetical protein M0D55_14780 [Elusimicrobiota bacterium]